MNTAMPLLDNLEVRKGIMAATDFDGMIENIMRGDYSRKPHGLGFGHGEYDDPTTHRQSLMSMLRLSISKKQVLIL